MKSIQEAFLEELKYIDDRRTGKITSMKTPWSKINSAGINGWEWGTISTIGAMSGGGKTAMINQLVAELDVWNPKQDIAVLFFTLEMAPRRLIGRTISHHERRTLQDIYTKATETDIERYKNTIMPKFVNRDIWYIEIGQTPGTIRKQIERFCDKRPGKHVLVLFDHTTLAKRQPSYGERDTLIALLSHFNELKKIYPMSQYLLLSQLNRDLESEKRIATPSSHFPKKSDFFGSDACYQFSDVILGVHNPSKLGIKSYGPQGWQCQNLIFAHILKARDGNPNVMSVFKNDLKFNRLIELTDQELITKGFKKR